MSRPTDPYVMELSGIAPAPGWRMFEGVVMEADEEHSESFEVNQLDVIGWVALRHVPKDRTEPLSGDSRIWLLGADHTQTGYFIYLNPFNSESMETCMQSSNRAYKVLRPGVDLDRTNLERDIREQMEWDAQEKKSHGEDTQHSQRR